MVSRLRGIVSNFAAYMVMIVALLFAVTIACLCLGASVWLTLKVWQGVITLL